MLQGFRTDVVHRQSTDKCLRLPGLLGSLQLNNLQMHHSSFQYAITNAIAKLHTTQFTDVSRTEPTYNVREGGRLGNSHQPCQLPSPARASDSPNNLSQIYHQLLSRNKVLIEACNVQATARNGLHIVARIYFHHHTSYVGLLRH